VRAILRLSILSCAPAPPRLPPDGAQCRKNRTRGPAPPLASPGTVVARNIGLSAGIRTIAVHRGAASKSLLFF
jgi:hypothetical protein